MKTLTNIACIIGFTATSQAAVLSVSYNAGNSTWTNHSSTGTPDVLFTDSFSYDPSDPTANAPLADWANRFHIALNNSNTNPVTLAFDLGSPTTFGAGAGQSVVFDIWGRYDDPATDNNFDIFLYNGGTQVGSSTGNALPDVNPAYARVSFNPASATTFDNFTIVGHDTDSNGSFNLFTLAELRVATIPVPEPSSTALLGLGALALVLRRRK